MSTTTELLDRYKAAHRLTSDAKLGKALGLKPSSVSNYRQGVRHAEPETLRTLALALGEDPELLILKVQAERETIPARKRVWLRCVERLSAAAALTIIGVWTSILPNAHANIAEYAALHNADRTMHMHRFIETLLRWFVGRFTKTGVTPWNLIARPA